MQCSLQVWSHCDTHRPQRHSPCCTNPHPVTPKLPVFHFNPQFTACQYRPVGRFSPAALQSSMCPCRPADACRIFIFWKRLKNVSAGGISSLGSLRTYGVLQNSTHSCQSAACVLLHGLSPLGTRWEHTNTCVCQLPGIQGPMLAVLSHFSRCSQSCRRQEDAGSLHFLFQLFWVEGEEALPSGRKCGPFALTDNKPQITRFFFSSRASPTPASQMFSF